MSGGNTHNALGSSVRETWRKWIVWIDGKKKKGDVAAPNAQSAETAARTRWHCKQTAMVEVKPRFPVAADGLLDGRDTRLPPSTPHDAHVCKAALVILGWTRETLRSRVVGVKNQDLDNLFQGGTNGAVKARVFKLLDEAGCDPEDVRQLIERVREKATQSKQTGTR